MLVILTNDRLLNPKAVCQGCLLADQSGQPRWRRGKLFCGQTVYKCSESQPEQYECHMGFRLANID